MAGHKLSIIIVNYNTQDHVRKCLDSIFRFLRQEDVEVIVVDNNSPDRGIEKLISEFSQVRFLFRTCNDGFGAACNDGAGVSSGSHLLFLNPDAELTNDKIKYAVEFLSESDSAGIVSGLLTNESGKPMYSFNKFPDLKWEFFQTIGAGYDKEIERLLSKKEIKEGECFETDWFHGAFLAMRREDFVRIGGFSDKYFMYFEDVQICYDFRNKLGLKNVCIPLIRVKHATQSSLSAERIDNIRNFHMHRGKLLFIQNYGMLRRAAFILLGLLNILLRIPLVILGKKYSYHKREKLMQLLKIFKLYLSRKFLNSSKYVYVRR